MLPAKVALTNEAVPNATLVEVVAEDRPGLLYDLASAISDAGCDIDVVLIDTEAHKALDVFYLKQAGGQVPESSHGKLKESLLAACNS
jgi:[protein-PII] uridylyltransferase